MSCKHEYVTNSSSDDIWRCIECRKPMGRNMKPYDHFVESKRKNQ